MTASPVTRQPVSHDWQRDAVRLPPPAGHAPASAIDGVAVADGVFDPGLSGRDSRPGLHIGGGADEVAAWPKGSADAKAAAMAQVDYFYRSGDYKGLVGMLNQLETRDPAAFHAAASYLAKQYLQTPVNVYRNVYNNPVHTERLLQYADAYGSDETKAKLVAEVFDKVDPKKSAKYEPYMNYVFKWLEQPAVMGAVLEGDSKLLEDILMATPHWHWRHKNELHRLANIAARHYGETAGKIMKSGDSVLAAQHATKFGRLIGATERSIKSFYRGGASDVMSEVFGSLLKGLGEAAVAPLPPGINVAYQLAEPLVGHYIRSPEPVGPKKAKAARQQALALFDEIYWNTADPDMKLRTVDGGEVVPLTNVEEYRDLSRKLDYLRTFIRDGIGLEDE